MNVVQAVLWFLLRVDVLVRFLDFRKKEVFVVCMVPIRVHLGWGSIISFAISMICFGAEREDENASGFLVPVPTFRPTLFARGLD